MDIDKMRFVEELTEFVWRQIDKASLSGDYIHGAVMIVDARNCLFRYEPLSDTDEERDVYALRRLCTVGDDMETVPDAGHIERLARTFFD